MIQCWHRIDLAPTPEYIRSFRILSDTAADDDGFATVNDDGVGSLIFIVGLSDNILNTS